MESRRLPCQWLKNSTGLKRERTLSRMTYVKDDQNRIRDPKALRKMGAAFAVDRKRIRQRYSQECLNRFTKIPTELKKIFL